MKVRKVKIGIRNFDETLDEVAETAKAAAAGKKVKPKGHRLFFTSPEALRRFLTPKKLELIRLSLTDAGMVDLMKNGGRKTTPHVADELHLEIVV